jgi:putative PIN family toxin of toxin-antitoxin system
VIVSSFLTALGNPAKIRSALEQEQFELVVSEELLFEYQRALAYPRVARRYGMTSSETAEIVDGLRTKAILTTLSEVPEIIREDPADNMVLATARDGEAAYIVSGDDDLQRLGEYNGIQILSPAGFLALLEHEM